MFMIIKHFAKIPFTSLYKRNTLRVIKDYNNNSHVGNETDFKDLIKNSWYFKGKGRSRLGIFIFFKLSSNYLHRYILYS